MRVAPEALGAASTGRLDGAPIATGIERAAEDVPILAVENAAPVDILGSLPVDVRHK